MTETKERTEEETARLAGFIFVRFVLKTLALAAAIWWGSAIIINIAANGFTWGNTPWLIVAAWLFFKSAR